MFNRFYYQSNDKIHLETDKQMSARSLRSAIAKLVSVTDADLLVWRWRVEACLINERRRTRCHASNSSIYLALTREVSPLTLISASLHRLVDIKTPKAERWMINRRNCVYSIPWSIVLET